MRQPLDFIDPGAGDSEIVKVAGGHLRAWGAENERLRAALREIGDLDDVRCDEAPTIARRALGFNNEQAAHGDSK